MRILVIEDEARLAQTLAELLHRQGYTADISGDGLSGLDNAASDIYDLVVLDAMLPGMDGFTLLQRLRQEGHTVPVLMLTARSGVEDRVRGLDSGADYYLTKPFEPQELLACVRLLLRRTDGQPRQEDAVTCGDLRLEPGTFFAALRPAGGAAEPEGVRPDGAADPQLSPDRYQGAADPEGVGL